MWRKRVAVVGGMITVAGSLFFGIPAFAEVEVFYDNSVAESVISDPETSESEFETEMLEEQIITKEVGIREKFHSDFDLYENSIQDKYFFYSNISNGGITDLPVYFEFPAELQIAMEKDGVSLPYVSGQQLYEIGNYLMRLSVSEQREGKIKINYKAVFRFKIQEKKEEASDEEEISTVDNNNPSEEITEESVMEETMGISEGILYDERIRDEDNNFHFVFDTGVEVICSIPNGMITSKSVTLEISGKADYRIYKDNYEIEWNNEGVLQERGDYTIASGGEVFCFRISDYLTNAQWYYPPEGFRIITAAFQNNKIELLRDDCIEIRHDGRYQMELVNDDGFSLQCVFEKDSLAPDYKVIAQSHGVSITYISNDIDRVFVYKDGKEIGSSYNNMYEEGGKYRLIVWDLAGNQTVKEFIIPFHMNGFTIALLVLMTVMAAVLTIWIFIMKNKIRVR